MKREKDLLAPDVKPTIKDKLFYSVGMGGAVVPYILFSSLMMFYYTDVVGISAGTVGTMMVIAAIWDGINDPLMGILVDHTHTRFGKARPYILIGGIAIAITTVMGLNVPELSETGTTIYMYVTYILMGMSFTCLNMSIPVLMTRITRDQTEIASLNVWSYFSNNLMSAVMSFFLMSLLIALSGAEGNMRLGFSRIGWIFAAIVLVCTVLCFLFVKERDFEPGNVSEARQKTPLKDYLHATITNKHFLILILSGGIVLICYMFWMSVIVYYCTYNLGDAGIYSPLTALSYVGCFIPLFLLVPLVKRFDKKKLYISALIVVIMGSAIRFILNDTPLIMMYILCAVTFLGYGLWTVLLSPMLVDTANYMRLKTGIDTSGLILSSVTMVSKIGTGIAQATLLKLMEKYGYIEGAAQQPQGVLDLFRNCSITVLMIGAAVALVVILFYTLKDKELAKLQAEEEAKLEAAEV